MANIELEREREQKVNMNCSAIIWHLEKFTKYLSFFANKEFQKEFVHYLITNELLYHDILKRIFLNHSLKPGINIFLMAALCEYSAKCK